MSTSVAAEVADLHALAARLSEPWPAERRAARWMASRDNTLDDVARARSPHVEGTDGYWQHRRDSYHRDLPRGPIWRGSSETRDIAQADAPLNIQVPLRPGQPWMTSIAGVGPIVLRFAADDGPRHVVNCSKVKAADQECTCGDWPSELRWYVEGGHGRRAEPTLTQHLGARPRRWSGARARRAERRRVGLVGVVPMWPPDPRFTRSPIGTLAARYTPRRPDGTYSRHDARRWMRRFAQCVEMASDAFERDGDTPAARAFAIEVLSAMVSEEDASQLISGRARPAPSGRDYGISLDSPLDPPTIGTRRRIEPGSRPLPFGVNLHGMAPDQPSRFKFTHPGQSVDLERRADGWHVVGRVRAGATTALVGEDNLRAGQPAS